MPAKETFTGEQIETLLGVVRRARKRFKNQTDLAKALHITQPALSAMLNGKWAPGVTTAQYIAELEQLDLAELLPDFKAPPKTVAPAASDFPILERVVGYYEDEKRWSPWTLAAARAGFWENDVSKTEWVDRLDHLEKALARARKAA